MPGNTIGQCFRVTTFGESHGPVVGAVVDGCPAQFPLTEADIQPFLDKRKPGQSSFVSQRQESDRVSILSGVFEGLTTGAPILLLVQNEDARAKDYEAYRDVFRPGHADYTYYKKYGHRDHRGGGRASARETVARVAAGAIASKFLGEKNIIIRGCVAQLGEVTPTHWNWDAIDNPFFFPDATKIADLESYIDSLRRERDSVGAKIAIEVLGLPVGLGEPVFDKLEADLAHALMSIPAVRGVEIGDGFAVVTRRGSEHRDALNENGFLSNHAGGVLGGISTGQVLRLQMAVKPTSSIPQPIDSVDMNGNPVEVTVTGRHDPCVGIRAVPVAEAMVAIVLMDHFLRTN